MSEPRPIWRDGIEPVRKVYARHGGGCCLHVLIDDKNIDRSFIAWTLETALEHGHEDCIAAARILATMSPTQVGKLANNWYPWRETK